MKLVTNRQVPSVSIDGQVYNAIQQGLLPDLDYAVRKVMQDAPDEEDKMNLSVKFKEKS